MNVAMCYTTHYNKELSRQTLPRVTMHPDYDLHKTELIRMKPKVCIV